MRQIGVQSYKHTENQQLRHFLFYFHIHVDTRNKSKKYFTDITLSWLLSDIQVGDRVTEWSFRWCFCETSIKV